MTKFFKIKKKHYFRVMFAQRELFLKPLAMYNCRGTPAFKYQRYRVGCELFHHYEHAKII